MTGCAHCYQYYKVLYPKLGLDTGVKVWHITEYLAELVEQGKLKPTKPVDMTVTYHDPCHLGRLSEPWIAWKGVQRERHMRVYDPPRTLRRGTYGVYEPPRDLLQEHPRREAGGDGAHQGIRLVLRRRRRGEGDQSRVRRLDRRGEDGGGRVHRGGGPGHRLPALRPEPWQATPASDLKVYDVVEILDKAI